MKKTILFLFVMIIANISFSQTLTDSLLIYYPFSGNMLDSSSNGFHGQGNATLTTDRFGNINEAYSFNGVDQYIDLPFSSALKPQLPVTFSFWVKLESLDPSNGVFFTTDWANNNHNGCWMGLSSTHCASTNFGNGHGTYSTSRNSKIGDLPFQVRTWHHVVGVIRGYDDMDLYIDCQYSRGYYSGSGTTLNYSSTPGSIGRKDANGIVLPSYYMWGSMDEFCYWNRALSATEISQLCTGGPFSMNDNSKPLSINDNSSPFEAYVSPNPANSQIQIHTSIPDQIAYINIYNTMGQIVYNQEYNGNIDISNLNSGLYIVHLINKDNANIKTLKFNKI